MNLTDNQLWIVHATVSNVAALIMMYRLARLIVDRFAPPKIIMHEKDL